MVTSQLVSNHSKIYLTVYINSKIEKKKEKKKKYKENQTSICKSQKDFKKECF